VNRIDLKFNALRVSKRKGFVAYIGAGDPNLDATAALAHAMEKIGVDVLELGVPFSDPLADGVVNQLAAERGLQSGTTLRNLLKTIAKLRQESCEIPIVFYVYYNLIHHYGIKKFVKEAVAAGVDGVLTLDLPPEEAGEFEELLKGGKINPIYLIAPTTPESRIKQIAQHASGFLYYVSREGVTGMQKTVATNVASVTRTIRKHTNIPIAVGFGVSNPKQARAVALNADAVVMGSAIVNQIALHGHRKDLVKKITQYLKPIVKEVKLI